jgi:hypothetical protein
MTTKEQAAAALAACADALALRGQLADAARAEGSHSEPNCHAGRGCDEAQSAREWVASVLDRMARAEATAREALSGLGVGPG